MNLDEIRARVDAATGGQWWAWDRGVGWHIAVGEATDRDEYGRPERLLPEGMRTDIGRAEDAEFIAHARADVPWLLDRLDQIRRLCENCTPEPPPLFRGPGLSEHGEGYNHGTRDMAGAILQVLNGEEEST